MTKAFHPILCKAHKEKVTFKLKDDGGVSFPPTLQHPDGSVCSDETKRNRPKLPSKSSGTNRKAFRNSYKFGGGREWGASVVEEV